MPYKDVLNSFTELIIQVSSSIDEINADVVESITKQAQKAEQRVRIMSEDICKFILDHKNSEDYNLNKRRIAESVMNIVEV